MATLIVDIETVGEQWDDLDATTKAALTRWIDRTARDPGERAALHLDVAEGLGFSPLTGRILVLGIYDRERRRGTVYVAGAAALSNIEEGEFTYKSASEAEMLEIFWEGVTRYDVVVTFNGRAFDLPFMVHRSVAHGLRPSVDLLSQRYLVRQQPPFHVDLQDELTFYGAMARRPSLHLFCRAYGIDSPKGEVGGDGVARLYAQGGYLELARYNARDLVATAALYEKWLVSLAPADFVQNIDF